MYGIQSNSATAAGPGVREVLDAVRHLVRALRLSQQQARRHAGVSAAQLFVLQSLQGESGLSLNELAARTATDQSSVSVVVSRLVEAGLVRRQRSAGDARRLELGLTARAQALLRRAPAAVAPMGLLQAVEQLSVRDRRELGQLLGQVVSAMGEGQGTPGMFFESPPRGRVRS